MVEESAQPWWKQTWKATVPLRGSLVGAVVLIFVDVVLTGSRLFSSAACPIWCAVSIVKSLVRRPSARVAVVRVLVPVLTLLVVWANASIQNRIAMANAAKIIGACEAYRQANGSLPGRLDQLVPDYISAIPRAKYCLYPGKFWYLPFADDHVLAWYEVSPFDGRVYNFENGTWQFIDGIWQRYPCQPRRTKCGNSAYSGDSLSVSTVTPWFDFRILNRGGCRDRREIRAW